MNGCTGAFQAMCDYLHSSDIGGPPEGGLSKMRRPVSGALGIGVWGVRDQGPRGLGVRNL